MPLLEGSRSNPPPSPGAVPAAFSRRFSEQYSDLARVAIMTNASSTSYDGESLNHAAYHSSLMPPSKTVFGRSGNVPTNKLPPTNAMGRALTDTPAPSAPTSPQMSVYVYLVQHVRKADQNCSDMRAAVPTFPVPLPPRSVQPRSTSQDSLDLKFPRMVRYRKEMWLPNSSLSWLACPQEARAIL